MTNEAHYQAYLVRFQRGTEQPHWRVTIQNAQTGEQHHFAHEQEFFRFLAVALTFYSPPKKTFGQSRL